MNILLMFLTQGKPTQPGTVWVQSLLKIGSDFRCTNEYLGYESDSGEADRPEMRDVITEFKIILIVSSAVQGSRPVERRF